MSKEERVDPVWMTTAMLKAYAHPLRRQMIRLFERREHLRAADIATELGVPANSASFHLRVLADAGFIEPSPERGRDRRDRVWTVRNIALNLGGPENPVPDEHLGGAMIRLLAEEHTDMLRRVVEWTPEYVNGRDADVHAAFTRRAVRLTVDEFRAALNRVHAVFDEADEAHDDSDPEGRVWQIDLLAADDRI